MPRVEVNPRAALVREPTINWMAITGMPTRCSRGVIEHAGSVRMIKKQSE